MPEKRRVNRVQPLLRGVTFRRAAPTPSALGGANREGLFRWISMDAPRAYVALILRVQQMYNSHLINIVCMFDRYV